MEFADLCYIDSTGFHYADYPTVLEFVTNKYLEIFGADSELSPSTQDGQWIAILALMAYQNEVVANSTYNSFSPLTAQGVGLSRVVKINGIRRQVPTKSTVDLTCVGQSGTILGSVENPAIAIDTLGQKWILPVTTIPGGGSIVVTAEAEEEGSIAAAAGTVNSIYTPTLGWQTVNNVADASLGQPVEPDAELRVRQSQSTANPSLTVLEGTIGAVENVAGVSDVEGYENDTAVTDSLGIPAHSICVVVAGGDVNDIAEAMQIHKTPGIQTFGNTSVNVTDSRGMPLVINFQRPTLATINVQVTIATNPAWSADYEDLIKQAVADYINSIGIGARPNFTIYLSKLFSPAYLTGTPASGSFDISQIEISKDSDPLGSANISIDFDELPNCDPDTDVQVVIT